MTSKSRRINPAAPDAPVEIDLPDRQATEALAARLAAIARRGDAIGLAGDLGSGKTSFARSFIHARLGPDEEVPSPTFTLVQVYESPSGAIWHFDLYRIARPEEIAELGLEDALADGIALIEWPERLGALRPQTMLELRFEFGAGEEQRRLRVAAPPEWRRRLQEAGLV